MSVSRRSESRSGRRRALTAWAIAAGLLSAPLTARAQNATIVGYLANFDAINDTEGEKQGFEIELEGVQAADITRVFGQSGASCYIRYCIGSVTEVPAGIDPVTHLPRAAHVSIKWTANYDAGTQQFTTPIHAPGGGTSGTPSRVGAANAPLVNGEQCWSYGLGGAYPASGCEHFGVSTAAGTNPTRTVYRWLVGDPATGVIAPVVVNTAPAGAPPAPAYAAPVAIPHPVANVVVVRGAQQIEAAIQGPEPPPAPLVPIPANPARLPYRYGPPMWVRVFKTELDRRADLDELVGGPNPNGVIKDAKVVAPESEYRLMQFDVTNPTSGSSRLKNNGSPNGKHAVVRRYEFYKYVGKVVDPGTVTSNKKAPGDLANVRRSDDGQEQSACVRATPGDLTTECVTAPPDEIGDYIGAQMAAQNLAGAALADQEITGFTLPATVTIGDAPFTLNATGGGSLIPVSYAASGACSNTAGSARITIDTPGTCIVTASQGGNAAFAPAAPVTEWVTVLRTQTITNLTVPASARVGDQFTATALGGGSLNPVTFAASGGCSNLAGGALVAINATALCTVTASQAGNAFYADATDVSATVVTAKATPVVTAVGGSCTYSGGPCPGSGSAIGGLGDSLAITLAYSGTGGTAYGPSAVAPTEAGTYIVTVSTDGDDANEPGTSSAPITIDKAASATAVTCTPTVTFTGSPLTACTASASGIGLPATDITASLSYASNTNAGAASATAIYPGDRNHTGSSGSGGFTIAQASSTVTVSCPVSVPFSGSPLTPCTAAATGAGALDVALTLTYAANTNAGTATASATFAGDANHTGNTGSASFVIVAPPPPPATISIAPIPDQTNREGDEVELQVVVVRGGAATLSAISDMAKARRGDDDDEVRGGSFSAPALAGLGLKIDKDGEISGKIQSTSAAAPYVVPVTVSFMQDGVTVYQRFVWHITPAAKGKGGKR
jgi:hypothetical protein